MTSLNPVLTIERQLTEVLETHQKLKHAGAERRAIQLLEMVGIPGAEKRLHDFPHQFSGGMRQRVMIAMALACDPELLIADEPTTALDVTIQAQILDLMRSVVAEVHTALILITHDLGVVAGMCRSTAVMYAGRIIERSNTTELFGRPRHPYTVGLLRSLPRLDERERGELVPITGPAARPVARDHGLPVRPTLLQRPGPLPGRGSAAGAGAERRGRARGGVLLPGRGREAGAVRLRRRGRRMTDASLAPETTSAAQPASEAPLLAGSRPEGLLPDQGRAHLRAPDRRRARRRRRDARRAPRRDVGPGGRIRLRQVDLRARRDPAGRRDRGQHPVRRDRDRGPVRRPAAPHAAPDADDLPGPVRLPESAHDHRLHAGRAAARAPPGQGRRAHTTGERADRDGRLAEELGGALPARVQRRPAAARRHRAGPGRQAGVHRRRRGGLRAGRLDPGADHQPARRAAEGARA